MCGGSEASTHDREARASRSGRKLAKRVHANETVHSHKRATLEPSNLDATQGGSGGDAASTNGESSVIKTAKAEWGSQPKASSSGEKQGGGSNPALPSDSGKTGKTSDQNSAGSSEPFSYIPRDQYTWDGEASWEWDYPKTLYFEPVAGLGNRLRALASAVVIAKEYGAALKVIWREEDGCGDDCGNPGFNSTWPDLFSEPKLRLADNFPGSTYKTSEEQVLRANNRDEHTPALLPGQCMIHAARSHAHMASIMANNFTEVNGEQILCVKSDLWLTEAGEKEGKFFFRLLKPSATVQAMIDLYKYTTEWEENHMVGVHVRRGDLTIYGKNDQKSQVKTLIPIEGYTEAMRKQKELAAGVKRVRFFLATDDAQAEAEIRAAFKPGQVLTYVKKERSRVKVQGIQEALVDVMLLADCPILIGTYYSSYSETAKLMGWPFYIQVGHALRQLSVETKFDKEDPEEEEDVRRRRLAEMDS